MKYKKDCLLFLIAVMHTAIIITGCANKHAEEFLKKFETAAGQYQQAIDSEDASKEFEKIVSIAIEAFSVKAEIEELYLNKFTKSQLKRYKKAGKVFEVDDELLDTEK